MDPSNKPINKSLAVTLDISDRFVLAWGTPTTGPSTNEADERTREERTVISSDAIKFEGVSRADVEQDGRVLVCYYAGKKGTSVEMHASVFKMLRASRCSEVLVPKYFIRGRTTSRMCRLKDGTEIKLLDILGTLMNIPNPSWKTQNCWRERLEEIVSTDEMPIGGTKAYAQKYYSRTIETRRKKARDRSSQLRKQDKVDQLIAMLRPEGSGGGGPQ